MHQLRVRLFGAFRLSCDCGAADLDIRPTARALLAYLLLHRRRWHRREVLAALFWGDDSEDAARRHLSHTLWRIRTALADAAGPHDEHLLAATSEEVGLDPEGSVWLDVAVFEAALVPVLAKELHARTPADAAAVEHVMPLYTGDLLEGHYDDWIIRERERLLALHLGGQACLMRHYRQTGDYTRAIEYGRQVLGKDPLREETHREMMRLYVLNHQRSLALQQFETCRAVLAKELGIAPMPETQALASRIATGRAPRRPARAQPGPQTLPEALRQLEQAMGGLDEARDQLRHALDHLVRLTQAPPLGHPPQENDRLAR